MILLSGAVCIGIDSKYLADIIPNINRTCRTFGIINEADIMAKNIKFNKTDITFDVIMNKKIACTIKLMVPGLHNVYNALSAISICLESDVPIKSIVKGLNKFCGVKRRFEIKYKDINNRNIMIIDDYAHHHTELSATIEATKTGWPNRRIIAIFQPHLFSRTKAFYKEFSNSLMNSDLNIIAPIYPAREEPIEKVSSLLIADELKKSGHQKTYLCENKKIIPELVKQYIIDDDIVIFMGAGSISKIAQNFMKINE